MFLELIAAPEVGEKAFLELDFGKPLKSFI